MSLRVLNDVDIIMITLIYTRAYTSMLYISTKRKQYFIIIPLPNNKQQLPDKNLSQTTKCFLKEVH